MAQLPKRASSSVSADEIGIFTQAATGFVYYTLLYLNIFFFHLEKLSPGRSRPTGNERLTGFTKTVFAAARSCIHISMIICTYL